jgi:hypothetical protein
VHDSQAFEALGLPAVFVASTEFRPATDAQARGLGIPPSGVFVQHPIQDRTDAEMRVLAEGAVQQLIQGLTAVAPR